MPRVALAIVVGVAGLLALGAGCVEAPQTTDAGTVRCDTSDECSPGQECIDHNCFGDAVGEFAAELFAPQTRTDMLARAEVEMLDISDQNEVDVMFGRSIEVTGRVLLHATDETSVAARVLFQRPSRIPGAPDYAVTVDAAAGKRRGEVAFRARLLPNEADESYTITIYPEDAAPVGGVPPSSLAPPAQPPPLRLVSSLNGYEVTLDYGGLQEVAGYVVDANGFGLRDMIVRAWGRRTTSSPLELLSSTAKTDAAGRYSLFLPRGRSTEFELRVQPGPGVKAPALTRRRVFIPATSEGIPLFEIIRYPELPPLARYQLPVTGANPAGGRMPAVGATVIFQTTKTAGNDTVSYEAQSEVGVSGKADLDLLPGAPAEFRRYKATVLPLPSSLPGSTWDYAIDIGSTAGEGVQLPPIDLPSRVEVSGHVRDSEGKPVKSMTLRPQLTPSFLAGAPAAADRLQALRLPEVTTDETGLFTLHLDATLAGMVAEYDLECVPPSGSALPRWSRDRVMLPTSPDATLTLDDINLPASSRVSGMVRDEAGAPVADAEVRVYMRTSSTTARQRAIGKSDSTGKISLVLPVAP